MYILRSILQTTIATFKLLMATAMCVPSSLVNLEIFDRIYYTCQNLMYLRSAITA